MRTRRRLAYEEQTANKTKTSTKQEQTKKQDTTKLLRPKAGYVQDTSPKYRNPCQTILNVLINLKNNAKSEYTIKFVDTALRRINKLNLS